MLLAIDIGNTNISFGVFDNENLASHFTILTNRSQTGDEIYVQIREKLSHSFSAIIISSVVPEINESFRYFAKKYFNCEAFFFDHTFDLGLKIKYDPPSDVGADRLVAAFAAVEKYGKPCIICDFGTATTIDAVNSQAKYLGGSIVAGMKVLADALSQETSKLPKIKIEKREKVIGDSTISAIQSGIYFGYAGLVEKILQKMIDELGETPKIIATGGFASMIAESVKIIEIIDENLVLEGLRLIYDLHTKTPKYGEN